MAKYLAVLLVANSAALFAIRLSAQELVQAKSNHSAEDLEWFERQVRPLLLSKCSSCHSSDSDNRKGGLSLEDRESVLAGGESGPAIIPGDVDGSLLIEAVRRESFEMPPDKPLSSRELAILEEWVERGAPWPRRSAASQEGNWLEKRLKNHWAWTPVSRPSVPILANDDWSQAPLDRFVLSELRSSGLDPATRPAASVLKRRMAFDLTGLPPSSSEEETLEEFANRLIHSPQFGVHWGRHWLDLVRYAETLGHEFDYPVKHAWRYRDCVVDSLNGDIPYNQFVREHIAGDLIEKPRYHTTTGINQSLALTGFWFLGDSVHAPTDIQNDWALRVDNQIDVASKAFMGMTIACARCHDHKFDAIGVDDYYGMAGMLESTRRIFRPTDPHGKIAKHNAKLQSKLKDADRAWRQNLLDTSVQPERLLAWIDECQDRLRQLDENAQRKELAISSPLHFFSVLLEAEKASDDDRVQADAATDNSNQLVELLNQWQQRVSVAANRYSEWESTTKLFADFAEGLPTGWRVEATGATTAGTDAPSSSFPSQPWWIAQSEFDVDWFSAKTPLPANPNTFGSQRLGVKQHVTLQSPVFDLAKPVICIKGRGQASISALVIDNYFMNEVHSLLFKDTRKSIAAPHESSWTIHQGDVNKYVGETAYLSFEDAGSGWFEIKEIRFADSRPPVQPSEFSVALLTHLRQEPIQTSGELKDRLIHFISEMTAQAFGETALSDPASLRSILLASERLNVSFPWPSQVQPKFSHLQNALRALDNATPEPTVLLAATESNPRDTAVALRGDPHQRGQFVSRQVFRSLSDISPPPTSSGRLELAQSIASKNHPLTARVIVNRIWHHLMGRGLVPSPDNFGVLGGRPTHPELLDYLAAEFVQHDWSVKWLVQEIVNSSTYQMGSSPSKKHNEFDADHSLWSHRPVRRLSAESIRDTLLSTAGVLDHRLAGPSVPVHLNEQMTGRGRPGKSGPLDGYGRRSVYVEVRRNFLDPFLLAFDFPMPSTSAGKRTQSNVPAQALGLLNDPLVTNLIDRWLKKTANAKDNRSRIAQMFNDAYQRAPTPQEATRCLAFIEKSDVNTESSWRQLAHVLVNSKEFAYIR